MVGHADDLVRDNLARGDDEIIALVHNAAVDLDADGIVPEALGDFFQIAGRDLADLDDVVTPVVHDHILIGHITEHDGPLLLGHGLMRAERGHDVDLAAGVGEQMVIDICNQAGLRMKAREIRRNNQGLFYGAAFKRSLQRRADFFTAQAAFIFGIIKLFHKYPPRQVGWGSPAGKGVAGLHLESKVRKLSRLRKRDQAL